MQGIKLMKPKTNVAIDPNWSSIVLDFCKKMKILSKDSINIGMKIVAHALPGNL
jgi:orotidine-5'-phosphate decarboxylase